VSTALRSGDGFHIFKVEEVTEEREKSIDEVKDQITQSLKKEKAKAEASRKADEAFYSLFRSRDLEKYARENNLPIKTTGFFKEGDEVPEIGKDPTFYSNGLSLKVGEISPVVNVPPNFYILKSVGKKDSRIPPLEEVQEEVKRKLIAAKSEEKSRQVVEGLLAEVRTGKAIKEVATQKGLQVEETGFFPRVGGLVPKIGPSGGFMNLLSSLTEKNPVPKEALKTKDGYFVVKLLATEPADLSKFPPLKTNLEKRLILQKQEEFFENWLGQLRAKAKIDRNKDVLKVS
jgi:parvulin-like peptidyl-prolyl isomerase